MLRPLIGARGLSLRLLRLGVSLLLLSLVNRLGSSLSFPLALALVDIGLDVSSHINHSSDSRVSISDDLLKQTGQNKLANQFFVYVLVKTYPRKNRRTQPKLKFASSASIICHVVSGVMR